MIDYIKILKEIHAGVLATQDSEGVKTRYLSPVIMEGQLYFTTTNDKPVYAQLCKNPNVSYCASDKNYNPVISLNGKVKFVDDMYVRACILMEFPSLKNHYKIADNPKYVLFTIDISEVEVYTHTGGKVTHPLKNE